MITRRLLLIPGTRLGVYQITAPLGEGGMGQVWRATDTTLGRQVAIKILPDAFAADPERLARFEREAKTLASLNHPHIAAIYAVESGPSTGSGQAGTLALVMELVEGDDLSQRIARGAIPIDEALPIAKQIAEALEAAHEQGIVHRDLKPANIKVRADGTVKVLDFGLAKAMDPSPASATADNTQTITSPAQMTGVGVILGTAAYMAPEQARGKRVDKRADIWAFGAVLFEMLTGTRAFGGDDVSEVLSRVLQREPEWAALPSELSPTLVVYLKRCLHRDLKQRVGDIRDVRLALEGAFETAAPQTTPLVAAAPRSVVARALPWVIASVAVVVAGVLLTMWAPWRSAPVPAPRKLLASIGADASLSTALGASAILSPDGTTLVFAAQAAGRAPQLFVRKLDQLQAAPLAGTEGATSPFFSPDGQRVGFFADGQLKKVSVTGGAAITLCDAPSARGGTWSDDDTIFFTPTNGATRLTRISAAGGTPTVFGTLSAGATVQRWPQALPGGRSVLYTEASTPLAFDSADLVVAALSGGTPKVVVRGGYYGRYVPSRPGSPEGDEDGHLIFVQRGTLFAVPFDLDRLETRGQAVPAIDGLGANPDTGGVQLSFSLDGTLVYVPGSAVTGIQPIDWMTRDGQTSVLRATAADWVQPRFSPDGQKLALSVSDGKQRDIWVYEWARDTLTQLTFDPGQDQYPVWTPDGRRIVFASDRAKTGISNLYWVNADGTGEVARLTDSPSSQAPGSWHPSGKLLAFGTGGDLMVLPMTGDAARGWTPGAPTVFLSTPAGEGAPMFSPDGRWLAYNSNESGTPQVYVRPFPGPGGTWRVSTDGGMLARWSAATRELLFMTEAYPAKVMVAPFAVNGDSFRAETPRPWSPTGIRTGLLLTAYDLHPDGKRLAVATASYESRDTQDKVVFVFNFADYLRTIAPGTK